MIFNTSWFLVFFPVFYALFWLVPTSRTRLFYVLVASAVFHYHFAGRAGVLPIIVMGLSSYAFGLVLPLLAEGAAGRKAVLIVALWVPVAGLVWYKYRLMLLGSVPAFAGLTSQPVALPLAISFFTFEFVHYLTDVAHGSEPIRSPLRFAFFSIFFPSIVSGPIKRFQPFLAQVSSGLARPTLEQALNGCGQVLVGFFKKLVVADNAALLIGFLEKHPTPGRGSVCLLVFLLSVRILFDFSGYSDIAIGLGRLIGVELPQNFRYPYAASNLSEFWQRWHISLSSWIRDYIYIPLGGGHASAPRKAVNLSVTMFLCGLWHGPAWHFGLWGLYHGLGLAAHGGWERSALSRRLARLPGWRFAGTALTDAFVAYGWLLFFYPLDRVAAYTRILLGIR